MIDDTQPGPSCCQLSGAASSGPSSTALSSVLPRKAGRATGLEWAHFTGLEAGPVCGLWERQSTLSFGGRKCIFHTFPGSKKSTDLTTGDWESSFLVPMMLQRAGPLKQLTFWWACFPICKRSRLDPGIFPKCPLRRLKDFTKPSSGPLWGLWCSRLPLPLTTFPDSFCLFYRLGFLVRFCLKQRVLRLKMFENFSGLFWLEQCAICRVVSDSGFLLAASSSVLL